MKVCLIRNFVTHRVCVGVSRNISHYWASNVLKRKFLLRPTYEDFKILAIDISFLTVIFTEQNLCTLETGEHSWHLS